MSITFQKLALGGGGMKGVLHIGALQELAKYQPLEFPDGVYGCSIGSIIAAYVAFGLPLDNMKPLLQKYLSIERVIPKSSFLHMLNVFTTKGMYSMDLFEQTIIDLFADVGVDIKDKKISDSKMPLYIIASNITKGIPSVLSGNVNLIMALKCSCCIPGVFRPQELYGNLYVDGDLFNPCIANIVNPNKNTLILSLIKQTGESITVKNIDKLSPIKYACQLYLMMMFQFYRSQQIENMISLYYPNLRSNTEIKDLNLDEILKSAARQLERFMTNRIHESLSGIINGGDSRELIY